MRAVVAREPGGPEVLEVRDVADPEPSAGEVVVDITASAVNRADIMQRMGHYPPPPGASDVLGLEASGTVSAVGKGVERWQIGDRVAALLSSGGYADKVAVPAGQLLPVPDNLDLQDAAALPEVIATVWSNVFTIAGLQPGELLLAHGGAGGIGTMAIQMAKALGARVAVTVGSDEKAQLVRELGADLVVNYKEQDFVEVVRQETDGAGADVVLDVIGAKYLARNIAVLARNGRLVVIGLQGGSTAELDLGAMLAKRVAVFAASLRGRPLEEKAAIVRGVRDHVWPLLASGAVHPVVHATYPLADAAEAHRVMAASTHIGKLLLVV
jgi:putative PIG3 family NAD(P)H quinone oxidoreductase